MSEIPPGQSSEGDKPGEKQNAELSVQSASAGKPDDLSALLGAIREFSDKRSADLTTLVSAIRSEGVAYRKEEQREDRGKKFREWITIGLIAVTFGAVCWQVREMIKVYEPIRLQAEAAQKSAEAASRAADAAKFQSEAMSKQAATSAQAIIGSQRAWVGPQNASFAAEPSVGKPIDITIQYQNSGREPALNFIYFAAPILATLEEEKSGKVSETLLNYMNACKAYTEWSGGSVIYPTTGFNSYNLSLKSGDDFVDEAATKGDKLIIVQACFLYRSFNIPRHSYSCYFFKQTLSKIQNLNICATGHYAD